LLRPQPRFPPASPSASGAPTTSGDSQVQGSANTASGAQTAATVSGATVSAAPAPGSVASVLGTTAPAPTVASGLAATQQAAIPCGNAYIVQVASELDQATFARRVSAVQLANQLPPGAKWTQTSDSCAIFTAQINALVPYSGPYASPFDACPARLASPPDAFIKGTTPDTANTYVSCLCPADASSLPAIRTVGELGVWIGELQRVLGSRLDYNVGSINADPSVGDPGRWGTYTADTAAAVGRLQRDAGLPVTSQVDAATWAVLRAQSC
jgi:Putative peptidoglycan binding domain